LLALCLFGRQAQAKFAGGTGQPNDPYQIATAEQLISIGSDPGLLDKHFVLLNDIDLDPNLPGGRIFSRAVIAPDLYTKPEFRGPVFTGSLHGNGHTIKHLTIRNNEARYLGLFGKIGSKGSIHDLRLEDIRVSSSGLCISGLVGYNRGRIANCRVSGSLSGGTGAWCSCFGLVAGTNIGHISHCEVNGVITTGSANRGSSLGLLVGQNRGTTSACVAAGWIRGGDGFSSVGGLIGKNVGSVADCRGTTHVSMSTKSGSSGNFGGLVGTNEGPISRSCATGSVAGGMHSQYLGGLAGLSGGTIVNCYATGDVSGSGGNDKVGGLVGHNRGHIVQSYARGWVAADRYVGGLVGEYRGSLSQCYATGRVTGGGGTYLPVGGLVGNGGRHNVNQCFWDSDASRMTAGNGGTALTTAQMHDRQTFITSGWDFVGEHTNGTADVWLMPKDRGYPLLAVFSDDYELHKLEGSGTPYDPYRIATPEDLGAIRKCDTTACYELVASVNLAGNTWTTPVIPSFEGKFNGNGFTVSNLELRGGGFLGLFGVLWDNAVVANLQVSDANIVAGSSNSPVGLLAAENRGRIANCRAVGNISGGRTSRELSGFVGKNLGTITDCDPIAHDGPYSVIVTDPEATRRFLKSEGIRFYQVWVPEEADLEGLETIIEMYLDRDIPIRADTWIDSEYVLSNLRRYNREYSGFVTVRGGPKLIICSMILSMWSQRSFLETEGEQPRSKAFTMVMDGGCSVVRVIFDAKSKSIVSIECNGET
jgi:hypothetical protein